MSRDDLISTTLSQKRYLGWNETEIVINREHLKKDAALRWELGQIEQQGPDFREKLANEMADAMGGGMGGGMGGDLGGGGMGPIGGDIGGAGSGPAGDTGLPEFGGDGEMAPGDIASQELGDDAGGDDEPLDIPDLA